MVLVAADGKLSKSCRQSLQSFPAGVLQLMLVKIVQPYHLKVFFSNKFVHASILDTLQNVCVTSVSTNNKLFDSLIGPYKPKNDVRACLAVAKLLAEKAQQLQV